MTIPDFFPRPVFNAGDWYWEIVTNPAVVYSSKRNVYVDPVTDSDFAAWLDANGGALPPLVADESEVEYYVKDVLPAWLFNADDTFIQPTPTTHTQGQLVAYAAEARGTRMASDLVVNGLPWSTDPLTYGSLNSAFIYVQQKTATVFSWKLLDGSFITLDKTDIIALHDAANDFGQNCFACEDATLDKIEAGTITTLEEIDAEFAAVSNVFTGLRDAKELNLRHRPKR
jgi:hypothetical protein